MSVAINQIINANVYMDGNSLLGKAKQFKLPDIEFEQIEHKGLGLVGTIKLPSGIAALEGEVTWDSFYPEVRAKAYNPMKNVQLMARSNLQVFDARGLVAEEPMVTIMNVSFSKTTGEASKTRKPQNTQIPSKCILLSKLLAVRRSSSMMHLLIFCV